MCKQNVERKCAFLSNICSTELSEIIAKKYFLLLKFSQTYTACKPPHRAGKILSARIVPRLLKISQALKKPGFMSLQFVYKIEFANS